jgi:hypothetical protein
MVFAMSNEFHLEVERQRKAERARGRERANERANERARAKENVGMFPEAGVVEEEEEEVFVEALETSTIVSTEPVGGATSL